MDFVGIRPPQPYLANPTARMPLGLLYVVGGAARAGFRTKVFDGAGRSPAGVAADVPEARCYGLSATALDGPAARETAHRIKDIYPESDVILGGPITLAADCIETGPFDSLVHGYADEAIAGILEDSLAGRLKERYHCCASDPDTVSLPYQYWPGPLGTRTVAPAEHRHRPGAPLITSRGCAANCCFCAAPTWCSGRVAFRDMDAIFRDVDHLVRRGVRVLRLSDDNFLLRRPRVREFCKRIRPYHEKYNLVWRPSLRVDCYDHELGRLMADSGCVEASVGVESADQAVLDAMDKGTTVRKVWKCLRSLGEHGIYRRVLLMCGCPGTTDSTLEHNARFLMDGHYEMVNLTVFAPLPGSPVWKRPEEYRCDLLQDDPSEMQFLFYGPDGPRDQSPFIDLWDYTYESLARSVTTTHLFTEHMANVNRG